MKALLLSVSVGQGHNVAAQAISDYIISQDSTSEVRIVDTLKYISPVLDKVLIGSYLSALQVYPKAFTYLYSVFNKKDDSVLSLVEKLEEAISWRILPLIREMMPEVIISTHPFTTQMLSVLREDNKLNIPTLAIITDYGSHALWVHPGIDYYVVAHESVVPEVVERGRSEDTVLPLGIPVRESFKQSFSRHDTLKKIGLDHEFLTVTLMGGSLALGNMKTILKQLDSIQKPFNIVVVAGHNEKVYDEALEIALRSDKSIAVLKYCDFMGALLQATDLLVTKPGGLTVTEALITGTPLAIFKAIGGQEEQNRQFLLKHNLAIAIDNGENPAEKIESLLFHENQLEAMRQRAALAAKPNSSQEIYHLLGQLIAQSSTNQEIAFVPELEEDGFTDKVKDIVEELKEKLESNRAAASFMSIIRNRSHGTYLELTDEELKKLEDLSREGSPQKTRNEKE